MPQAPNSTPDFIPAEPDFIPADGGQPAAPRSPQQRKADAYKSGAAGGWEPEPLTDKIARTAEPYRQNVRRVFGPAVNAAVGMVTMPAKVAAASVQHPKVTETEKQYGFRQDAGPAGRMAQEIERQVFLPMGEAAQYYKQHLSDPRLRGRLIDDMLSVLPEAVGSAGGTVVGGKALEVAVPTTGKAIVDYNPYGQRTRGVQGLTQVEEAIGDRPVDHSAIQKQLDKIFDLGAHAHDVPAVASKIAGWIEKRSRDSVETLPNGEKVTVPGNPEMPMTFMDLRKFLSALDQKIDWESIKGTKMERELKGLRKVMDVEAIKTAYKNGQGSKYVRAKADYRRAMKLEAAGRKIGTAIGTGTGIAIGSKIGAAAGHPLYGVGAGAAIGSGIGYAAGNKVVTKITGAGAGLENVPSEKVAIEELKTEPAKSAEAARGFGRRQGEGDVEYAVRRANIPENEKAEILNRIRQNEDMHKRAKQAAKTKVAEPAEPKAAPSWTSAELHTKAMQQAMKEAGGKWSSGVGERAQEILKQWAKEGGPPK